MKKLAPELEQLAVAQRYRQRQVRSGAVQTAVISDGQELLNFCSNDYLGMANHPAVTQRFIEAADTHGVGSGAAHLVNGHTDLHHELEELLADYTGRERALLFSTGYMANIGIAQAFGDKNTTLLQDKLNHASLVDAGKLAAGPSRRYQHNDAQSLALQLARCSTEHQLVLTDGVFSMDGDIAPLPALIPPTQAAEAMLMIDDAHGFGVLGETGMGCCEHFGLTSRDVPILMGTFGKAVGTSGAFVAGDTQTIEYLIQKARTYVYTTALPPAVAAATTASLHIIKNDAERRQQLQRNIRYFRKSIDTTLQSHLLASETAIQGILLYDNKAALAASVALKKAGIWVTAIRPPTVPDGTARLRITLSATHSTQQIDYLAHHINKILTENTLS